MSKNVKDAQRRRNPLSDRTNSSSSSSSSLHKIVTRCGAIDRDISEPISVFCSRMHNLNENKKNKNKGTSNSKIYNISENFDGVEGPVNLLKAKPLAVPCRKKRRVVLCEEDASEDPQLQDYIEKQKAYFKEVDEFQLPEEEVESVNELD